jgi:hypothetical protein
MGRLKTGGRIGRERLGGRGSCGGKSEMEARQWGVAGGTSEALSMFCHTREKDWDLLETVEEKSWGLGRIRG